MADIEEYFPRGGKKPTNTTHFKQSSNFLGAPEKPEKKKKKPKKKKSAGDDGYLSDEAPREIDLSIKNCAIGISYKTIKEGLLILGRVKAVKETKVTVMLPCRMMGKVMACHISEPYNKLLEAYVNDEIEKVRDLQEMFKPGQYVALRVLETGSDGVMLSMMPQHIYGGKTSSDLHNGAILQAAVSSVEDHGYVMDVGVTGARAFLPNNCVPEDLQLDVGMLTWCCVKSVSPAAISLSADRGALSAAVTRRGSAPPPGTTVEFIVNKPLENGIEGHIFNDQIAYIQRFHADTVKGKKPMLGQKIRARVLYIQPPLNTPYLSMKSVFDAPSLEEEQLLKEGDIIDDALVIKITHRTIYFKLGEGSLGLMSMKRVQVDEELDDADIVRKSYPIGSTHKVRILCYHTCDYTYSVTDEPGVLTERYFSLQQLRVGDVVDATVTAVADGHLDVRVGRLHGYVPHAHMTDVGVFVDPKKTSTSKLPKKKFKVGQHVSGRVLVVDPARESLLLTLKPTLLAPDLEVLADYKQAEVGKSYTGIIKYIRDYVLVTFFNNVTAYVPRHYVSTEPALSLTDAFHVGQIVNCTILKVDAEARKMSGSLTTKPFWPNKKRELPNKRKQNNEDNADVPKKKRKSSEGETSDGENKNTKSEPETATKEKKKNKKKKHVAPEQKETDDEPVKEVVSEDKKRNKRKKPDEEAKVSEESDAIETDIYDSDNVLTPEDLALVDLTDCDTVKKCKKRVVSLTKSVQSRVRRIEVVEGKILKLESEGLTAKNKKFHTAMHSERTLLEQRVKKLSESLKLAQEKLKEFGVESKEVEKEKNKLEKKKDGRKKENTNVDAKEEKKREIKEEKAKKEKLKEKAKTVKVVESLEPALELPSVKDFWKTNTEDLAKSVQEEESSSSEDEQTDQPKKKRKKLSVAEKLAKVRDEEERIRALERSAVDSGAAPASVDQFERALLANPDSSQLWIAYMAFHLQSTELDKARGVARKALSTISFREEQEKLNVWVALLNLENRFGTKESQQQTLEEALKMNDPYKVHTAQLAALVDTRRQSELTALVERMLRKYRRDPQVYIQCGGACFKLDLVEKARQVMQKAITVLDKKDHVNVLVQFALLERAHGDRERAEALFEQVLAVYPQRVDVCAVYVDMLLKTGDIAPVRQVMERMTAQKLPARKMKVLYKKWIEVEEKHGDKDQVESVRQRAMEFLEKAKF